MAFIPPETIEKARQVDLLTYMKACEPDELVHISGEHYCTREHDSLKISNGKWYWFSRGFGGYNALDYLIKVRGLPFTEAVERITGQVVYLPRQAPPKLIKPKVLLLPRASPDTSRVYAYLRSRGIDAELIDFCIRTGRLYESFPHHNAVFVGLDRYSKPRYANLRGVGTDFVGDASGSDKRYSFSIFTPGSGTVHLFESAIDLLSYATLVKQNGGSWNREHLVSLAGVYRPKVELQESSMPLALKRYLSENPEIHSIVLRLDNDATGGRAAKALVSMLSGRYEVSVQPPPYGKDYNDCLCVKLGIPITHRSGKVPER